MNSHLDNIINTFSKPRNNTEVLIKLFHQNRLPENVSKRESTMCKKCLTPWTLGKFDLTIKPSNPTRQTRRNHRIERLKAQIKSKQLSTADSKKCDKNVKRLQQQNNHVAIYKCFCSKIAKTKAQLKKVQKDKVRPENASCKVLEAVKPDKECKPEKVKTKKKKKKTAGLIIPPKTVAPSASSSKANLSKISQMLKQQNEADKIKKSSLNNFFK